MTRTLKTIGLIGGMSWESTTLYYQIMNQETAARLGGLNSARIQLASLNFAEIAALQKAGEWERMADILSDSARALEQAGADCILIGTNTMHRIAAQVQAAIEVPLLHIADITAQAIQAAGLRKVGLLGTRFTMEQSFYKERLAAAGIDTVIPDETSRIEVHRIIFDELCQGKILADSRWRLLNIVQQLHSLGAEGVILGCTELPMLLQQHACPLPVFDTTTLHAKAAVNFALQ